MNSEQNRLEEAREKKVSWKKWGPYLSERQWGTVREDYSEVVMRGITSPTIRPARARTGGEKTVWPAYPMISSISASLWRYGTERTPS